MLIHIEVSGGEYEGNAEHRVYKHGDAYTAIFACGPAYTETAIGESEIDSLQETCVAFNPIQDIFHLSAYRRIDLDGVPALDLLYDDGAHHWVRKMVDGRFVADVRLTVSQSQSWRATPYETPSDDIDSYRAAAKVRCGSLPDDPITLDERQRQTTARAAAIQTVKNDLGREQLHMALIVA